MNTLKILLFVITIVHTTLASVVWEIKSSSFDDDEKKYTSIIDNYVMDEQLEYVYLSVGYQDENKAIKKSNIVRVNFETEDYVFVDSIEVRVVGMNLVNGYLIVRVVDENSWLFYMIYDNYGNRLKKSYNSLLTVFKNGSYLKCNSIEYISHMYVYDSCRIVDLHEVNETILLKDRIIIDIHVNKGNENKITVLSQDGKWFYLGTVCGENPKNIIDIDSIMLPYFETPFGDYGKIINNELVFIADKLYTFSSISNGVLGFDIALENPKYFKGKKYELVGHFGNALVRDLEVTHEDRFLRTHMSVLYHNDPLELLKYFSIPKDGFKYSTFTFKWFGDNLYFFYIDKYNNYNFRVKLISSDRYW
ncbi:hypothetical protein QA601_15975 [Chitinispirillales bacterium ANBcel5]|uniref:hypothetical protein n=1 Tax=Cellulosispirillum alkaliphilum TaxID=3039283 RepID=UPI002A58BD76|nr:hypothetical protein [Chitinispirillales bacterium ANBcel5]